MDTGGVEGSEFCVFDQSITDMLQVARALATTQQKVCVGRETRRRLSDQIRLLEDVCQSSFDHGRAGVRFAMVHRVGMLRALAHLLDNCIAWHSE